MIIQRSEIFTDNKEAFFRWLWGGSYHSNFLTHPGAKLFLSETARMVL